jgi:hypothetical protein
MSRTKDQWIERTGGFRVGESEFDFTAWAAEIDRLEKLLVSGALDIVGRERTQRRLCELKGIDFDSDDD